MLLEAVEVFDDDAESALFFAPADTVVFSLTWVSPDSDFLCATGDTQKPFFHVLCAQVVETPMTLSSPGSRVRGNFTWTCKAVHTGQLGIRRIYSLIGTSIRRAT